MQGVFGVNQTKNKYLVSCKELHFVQCADMCMTVRWVLMKTLNHNACKQCNKKGQLMFCDVKYIMIDQNQNNIISKMAW